MEKISVLIPDGESPFAFHVLMCLAQVKGVEVHILSQKPDALCRYSRARKSFSSFVEEKDWLKGAARICAQTQVDVIMPVDWRALMHFAKHRTEAASLANLPPLESLKSLQNISDKGLLADFLQENKFPHPHTITSQLQFEKTIRDFAFPVLVKPRISGDGEGIIKVMDHEALIEHFDSHDGFFEKFIVQEYIQGEDIDCSVLCEEGHILAYTIQKALYPNPSPYKAAEAIEFVHHPQVFEVARKLMSALKWNGVAHIDMRVRASSSRVEIIEINPRYWGSIQGSLLVGVNFPYLACLVSLGETFPLPEYRDSKYMSAFPAIKRILTNKPSAHLLTETNLPAYFKDPLPFLMKWKNLQ